MEEKNRPVGRLGYQYFHMSLTVLIILSSVILVFFFAARGAIGLLTIVFLAGTIGGVANNYRRLQRLPLDKENLKKTGIANMVTLQLYISPLIGGIFGVVLYALFISGILEGALFPDFSSLQEKAYVSVPDFFNKAAPAHVNDAAKLLVWSYVAGFSEAFVPNVIDKLTNEAKP